MQYGERTFRHKTMLAWLVSYMIWKDKVMLDTFSFTNNPRRLDLRLNLKCIIMKVYVFTSAAHFNDECTDIMDVQLFTTEDEAIKYLEKTVDEYLSEDYGWEVFSKRPRHYQLIRGDSEYVAYVTEREI